MLVFKGLLPAPSTEAEVTFPEARVLPKGRFPGSTEALGQHTEADSDRW